MRKIPFYLLLLIAAPFTVFAAPFERDLYFGIRNNSDVSRLQEFLKSQSLYAGPITGNFFSLTREAVRKFQEREKIEPAAGFFGPKTRARANAATSNTALVGTEAILTQINALQNQLKSLQDKLALENAPAPVPPAEAAPVVPETPKVEAKLANEVRVSGASTSSFPPIADLKPYKLGEFLIENGTASDVLLASFEVKISDEMDSYLNRNHRVFFIFRNGVSELDELVSSTAFTFIKTPPVIGSPHKSFLVLPFARVIKSGTSQKASLWVEQLDYVRSGTLAVETSAISSTAETAVKGSFNFVLTKEPPL